MKTTRPTNAYLRYSDSWEAWEQCRKAMDECYREALQDPIGLLMSAEGWLAKGGRWSAEEALVYVRAAKAMIAIVVNGDA